MLQSAVRNADGVISDDINNICHFVRSVLSVSGYPVQVHAWNIDKEEEERSDGRQKKATSKSTSSWVKGINAR